MQTKNCIFEINLRPKTYLTLFYILVYYYFFHNFFTPYILDKVVGGTDFFMYTFGGIAPCFSNSKFLMCISIFG